MKIEEKTYMVLDLKDYSVSYLDDVPEGGWTDEYKTEKMALRYIPAGSFVMGSPESELGRHDDETQHKVTLTSPFYIGVFQVTQKQYELVTGNNPSEFQNAADSATRPVECVSWDDCQAFIRELNKKTGQDFRLPTEAEWEYAARGGKKGRNTKYSGSSILADVGWYKDNSSNTTSRVGQLSSNELGIFDMTGNVAEWVSDYYDYYPKED